MKHHLRGPKQRLISKGMKYSDIVNWKGKDLSSLSCQSSFDLASKSLKLFELLMSHNFQQETSDCKYSDGAPKDREGNISSASLDKAENKISVQ